jgi:hypothetical protein
MGSDTLYTVGWALWGVYFAALEGAALIRSHKGTQGGTLSEHVWVWFGTAKGTHANSWAYVRRFVLIAFMSWLTVHFVGGGQLV